MQLDNRFTVMVRVRVRVRVMVGGAVQTTACMARFRMFQVRVDPIHPAHSTPWLGLGLGGRG
jgi:hypothetical protein